VVGKPEVIQLDEKSLTRTLTRNGIRGCRADYDREVVSALSGVLRRKMLTSRVLVGRGTFDSGDLKEVAERRAMKLVPSCFVE
jgi:hypothetical protein